MKWTVFAAMLLAACGDNKSIECDVSGHACTWAGKPGVFGFNGDGNDRLDTELYWAMDMKFADDDSVAWFIDWNNHLVRRVEADDTVKTYLGWVDPIFPGDGLSGPSEKSPDGAPGLDVKLNHPTDLALLPDGKLLVMAWHNHKLRMIDPADHSHILGGGGAGFAGDGGPIAMATFKQPKALERDPADGSLYILVQQNFRIRKVSADYSMVTTIAGSGMQGGDGDGGPALSAKLNFEAGSNPEPSGGLALKDGKLYVADTLSNRIRVIDLAAGTIANFAGTGTPGFAGDGGPATSAQLNAPRDLEIGPDGDLYIADTDNSAIRAIDASGNIRTVAGTGELGLDPDEGRLATEMRLARPFGIEFDPAGNLYICDTINSRIVKVTK